jgi:TatD DNase family protein
MRAFEAQAFMAEEYQKPLIIHCVKAWNEIVELHKKNKPAVPWIFHGYNGSVQLDNNFQGKTFSFRLANCFSGKCKAVESFQITPLEKIFLKPMNLKVLSKNLPAGAELKNISVEKLKEAVWENFNRIENVSFTLYKQPQLTTFLSVF